MLGTKKQPGWPWTWKVRSRYHCCWQEVAHIHGGCVEHHDVGHRSSSPMAPWPRFYPLPFDLTLGTFQLLVVTANEVQDQLIHVHVFIRCHLIWLWGHSNCWWWQQTKSKISSWSFTFYIRCHLIWLWGHSNCWWWQQTKSKISSWSFTFYIRCHLIWLRGQSSCWWWQQTKSKISSWLFTFYIRCHLIWLREHSTCWWWQQTKSKISSWLFTFSSVAIWFDLGWLSCFWWWQHR